MASVSYGNTLTDLGRNIAEQKASANALAGILAQVGAQKLAALNALAANRGRTAADREVGLDRNATMRESAALEAMLKGQELSDRDRQYSAQIQAAQEMARIQGANQLATAGVPYGPGAMGMVEKQSELARELARIQGQNRKDELGMQFGPEALKFAEAVALANQRVDPRLMGDVLGHNIQSDEKQREAEAIAAQANLKADIALKNFTNAKKSWLRTTLNPFYGDADYEEDYVKAVSAIPSSFGDAAGLIEPERLPDGTFRFKAKQFRQIAVPQMRQPNTVTGGAGASAGWGPVPNTTNPDELRRNALMFARELKNAGVADAEITARVYERYPQARGLF